MKKSHTLTLGLLLAFAGAAQAQVLPEGFETLDLDTGGWTATQAEGAAANHKWVINTYAKETAQFPKNIPTLDVCGENVLKCTASGAFNLSTPVPDSKLVSPEITVGDNTVLSFLMACNFAGNAAATMTEEGKTHFSVIVSPTGDADAESFTDVVYESAPSGLNTWMPVGIDLSAYKGKTIRLMFRCYMNEMVKVMVANTLYIDNIDLVSSKNTDIKVTNLTGLFRGTIATQQATVDVINNGCTEIGNFILNFKVNDTTTASETVTRTLAPGETYTHEFEVTLPAGENTVTVDAVAADDCLAFNNTISATAVIDAAEALPFELVYGDTANDQFTTTRKGTASRPAGWMYIANSKKWVHTATSTGAKAYLYTSRPLHLEHGAIKVNVKGTPTSTAAEFEVFLTRRPDIFGDICNSVTLTPEDNDRMLLVNVPEAGDYYVAFGVTDPVATKQLPLEALTIAQAEQLPDIAVAAVVSPLFSLAGESLTPAVEIRNEGVGAATDIKVSYTFGENTVTETIATLDGGASVTHTFATPMTPGTGTSPLTFTARAGGDLNTENDTKTVDFVAYNAAELPYKDSFEDPDHNALWTIANANGDASAWAVSDGYEFDGTHIAALTATTDPHNDWLISPAVAIPADYSGRLSFYYGAGGNAGTAHIKAYLATSTDPAQIAAATPLADLDCNLVNVSYASVPVSGLEAGNYYIAFHAAAGAQALLIDDVRIDDVPEVAVTAMSVTNPEPAYDHQPSTVQLTLRNYGSSPVTGAKAAYTLYSYSATSTVPEAVETVEESIPGEIPADTEYVYSFSKQISYPKELSYMVSAAVTLPAGADADSKNNSFSCNASQRLVTMHAPALWDMELSDNLAGYTFDEQNSWNIGAVNPYDGIRSLYHLGALKNETGDKVVLNRVHLAPGTYQLSFFWQTTRNMDGDDYRQSFDVVMGDSPENMSKVVYTVENQTAHSRKHSKAMTDLTVDTEGDYFIGFNLRKGAAQGQLLIDNVRIEIPQAVYDMTARKTVYEADFGARADEWQHYHPLQVVSQQWTTERDAQLGLPYMQTTEFTSVGTHYTSSYLQGPALYLRGGCTYTVSMYPEILAPEQDGTPLTGSEALILYRSGRDCPAEFVELGRAQANTNGMYTVTYTPQESGLCYLSLLPYSEVNGVFRVHSFKVQMTAAPEDGNWEEVGTCSFTDPVFSAFGFEPQTMTAVVMERNADVENQYRLVNPYTSWVLPAGKETEFTFNDVNMTPIVFDIIDNRYVYVHPFNTGWSVNSGELKGEISCLMNAGKLLDTDLSFEQIIALAPGCLATLDYDRITGTATFSYYGYPEPPVFLARLSGMESTIPANTQGEFLIVLPENMIPDPNEGWSKAGTATMTEVFISGCTEDAEHQELECELQRKDSNPAVYRLVNPYASWKNSNPELFSYDSERPRFMVIHTENAPYAWFEEFATGVRSATEGMITGQCYAEDFIEALSLEKAIATIPLAFGKYEEKVFSFPEISCTYQGRDLPTVFTRFAATPNNLTRCNTDNSFKVVFHLDEDGVGTPTVDINGDDEFYSLQGLHLKKPVPGQPVIVRRGTRTFKAIAR